MTGNYDRDSKAALRVRCSSCGRRAADHPFCEKCGEPEMCGPATGAGVTHCVPKAREPGMGPESTA